MLDQKVSRNEPCPCGSGKKYKNCCGLQKMVSITSIIEKEIMELQMQLIQYALFEYEVEIESDFELMMKDLLTEDEEEMEFYIFVHGVWYALFEMLENGKTILEHFIDERSRTIRRPQVKEILQSWRNPRPIAGRMLEVNPQYMVIRDTLTDEVIQVKLLERIKISKESFIFAFLVPFGQEWIFFPTVFDSEGEPDQKEERFLQAAFKQSGYEDPIEFLTDEFLDLMNEMPFAMIGYGPNDFEWPSEAHKKVAVLFDEEMKKMDAPPTVIATGMILWYKFSEKVPRLIKKPESYAAAIHYLNMTVNPLIDVTKKEIAQKYRISPSTLGTAITDMGNVLQKELSQLQGLHLEQIVEAMEDEGIGWDDDFLDELEDWEAEFEEDEDDDI